MNNVKLICFYGPESTGKSTLVKKLALEYNIDYVPELAREIVTSNNFTVEDIVKIGRAQTSRVLEKLKTANRFLFCDTDVITTQIYCRHYLGVVPPELIELEKEVRYDHYLLFDIDVPWVADGMRDQGKKEQRKSMMDVFKRELDSRNLRYTLISGGYAEREAAVKQLLSSLF